MFSSTGQRSHCPAFCRYSVNPAGRRLLVQAQAQSTEGGPQDSKRSSVDSIFSAGPERETCSCPHGELPQAPSWWGAMALPCDPAPTALPASHWNLVGTQVLRPTHISWISNWESQFPGRLIRSPGSPRRRKGSGAIEVEIGHLEFSRRRKGQTFFFFNPSTFLSLSQLHNSV